MFVKLTREQAEFYRKIIHKAATSLSDEDALEALLLFPAWNPGTPYKMGDRILYDETLYRVLQDHRSQSDWTPDVASSLYAEVLIVDPTIIPEWVQPSSTNPYMKDDKVMHNNDTWISIIDYNVWEPGVYGWELWR